MEQTLPIVTVIVLILASSLVNFYASPGTPLFIRFLATLSFWLGFMGIALLPIDLARTTQIDTIETDDENNAIQENDDANMTTDGIPKVNSTYRPWLITYWSTFLLAYLLLPYVREVLYSGYFTLFARMKMAAKKLLRKHLLYFVAFLVCVVALAIIKKSLHIIPVLMTIANTYGLLLVALLMGYGLVDVPRRIWRKAQPDLELRRSQLMASVADEALFEAVWELQDCEDAIDNAINSIQKASPSEISASLSETHPIEKMPHDDCIKELTRLRNLTAVLDEELQCRRANRPSERPSSPSNASDDGNESNVKDGSIPTIDELAMLSARLKLAQANLISAEQKWNLILEHNAMYSALVNSQIPFPEKPQHSLSTTFLEKMLAGIRFYKGCAYYGWMTYLRSFTYRILAFSTACLSLVVLWSETTMAIPFNLSPFHYALRIFDEDGLESGILFKISALIPLLYMSACVYTSLFKVSFFGPNCLRGSKQSPGVALVFNAQYLIRMQFPLGFNYLNILKIEAGKTNCGFSKVMSHMEMVPLFGSSKGFYIYVPLLILALSYFTLVNVYPRILALLGIEHEDAILIGDRETLENQVNEGIVLLSRSQRKIDSRSENGNSGENGGDVKNGKGNWFSDVVV